MHIRDSSMLPMAARKNLSSIFTSLDYVRQQPEQNLSQTTKAQRQAKNEVRGEAGVSYCSKRRESGHNQVSATPCSQEVFAAQGLSVYNC